MSNPTPAEPERPLWTVVAEQLDLLVSADPDVRDGQAYPALVTWITTGAVDGALRDLGRRAVAMLTDPRIQARTFGALLLAEVISRDTVTGLLDDDDLAGWSATFGRWWRTERLLTGWDVARGWLHAVAHGADVVRALARSPRLDGAALVQLLELVTDRMLAPTDHVLTDREDERIAYAVVQILCRPEVRVADAVSGWERVVSALTDGEPGPMPPWAGNALHTLRTTFLLLHRGIREPDESGAYGLTQRPGHADELLLALGDLLAQEMPFIGGSSSA